MYGLVNILASDPQPFSYHVGELQMQECTCKCTVSLCIAALTAGFLPVVKTFTHTSWDLSTMCTTLQSKHVHLEFLFSQITPLANVSKIHTHHIWCKPNIFSLLDSSQYLLKVLQRQGRVPLLRIDLGLRCGQRDPELCDRAPLIPLVPCCGC